MSTGEHAGKRKYETQKDAERVLTLTWAKDPLVKLGDLHTYQCPKCKQWHIGHRRTYEKYVKGRVRKR